jgi:DNA-binding response OmpR family regulator
MVFDRESAMEGNGRSRLLLVEDESILRRLIAEFLRGEGFDVTEAADGSEGASLYAGLGPFDLVLLDLNLPFISGVDVCRRIKAARPAQPVLICSAAILDWHVVALEDLQVDQFLSKPYHPLELLDRIRRELSRPSRVRETGAGAGAGPRGDGIPVGQQAGGFGPVQAAAGGIK